MPGCCPTVLRSHFLACPRAVAWARKCLRVWGCTCCGRVCLRVAGVWCLRYCPCSCGCLCACLCALAWGCGVVWSCRSFAPACLLACLLACSRPGVGLLACARLAGAGWARGRPCWGGTIVSRPVLCGVGYFGRPVARKREAWRVGCSRCANTRAHAERGRGEGEGSRRPVQVLAWLGAVGGGGIPCWRAVPIRGRVKLTLLGRGRGALPAVVGFWWWVCVVVAILGGGASSFGCAWWFWWRGAFPLVVGWVGGNDFPR